MGDDAVRCTKCGTLVRVKVKTKRPKYCGNCRKSLQDHYRKSLSRLRKARTQNIPIGPLEMNETHRIKENQ